MAEIHKTTLTPDKLELLTAWLPSQRWFAGKGRQPQLRRLGGYRLDDPAGGVGIEVQIIADVSGTEPVVYQVPLTYRGEPVDDLDHALVGTSEHGVLGTRWVYDGTHDLVFAQQLLALVQAEVQAQASSVSDTVDPTVHGRQVPDTEAVRVTASRVLRGEQSNTSVILDVVDANGVAAEPLIVKVFRALHPGENPDVVVQSALTEAGSTLVPRAVGDVSGEWDDPASGQRVHGHLAFVQAFLPGVEDAWRVAVRAATDGVDFSSSARELGEATGRIHQTMARTLGTTPVTDQAKTQLVGVVRARAEQALAEVPQVADDAAGAMHLLDELAAAPWPSLQRIHGDYHLGQVLRTPTGWVAVDFEGEPLRPLSERVRPELALRDVAGMLRSFDYAGGSVELTEPGRSTRDWVRACQAAFLAGYVDATGVDLEGARPLLRGLELDKALYEAVYEVRNRPTWLGIPAAAIHRLTDSEAAP